MRKPWQFLSAVLLGASLSAHAIAPMDFDSPEQRERFQQLTEELRCLVCQNQSLSDSNAPLAQDLRREVLELLKSGKSNEEIRAFLVERYGDFVLYKPPVEPSTWFLWFGPGLILVIGAVGLAVAIRRRARAARQTDNGSSE